MRLRTQVAIIVGVAVVALGTTGAVSYTLGTSGGKPASAVVAPSAFPSSAPQTPAVDHDREACRRLSGVGDLLSAAPEADVMAPVVEAARLATDTNIRDAGDLLVDVYAAGDPEPGEETIFAARVTFALDKACAARYGDGPW